MSIINVKTKEGRVAFDRPLGTQIPNDKFVPVEHTDWIDRLLNVHEDIVAEREPEKKPALAANKS